MINAVDCIDSGRQAPVPWRGSDMLADLERDGGGEFVRDLIDTFLRDTAVRLGSMRNAAASADLKALAAGSHAIRGSALQMNAGRLAELCGEIERRAAGREHLGYLAMIDKLDLALRETREAMISYETGLPQV